MSDGPFKDKQEAEGFLLALKTCTVEFKKVVVSWGEGKEPNLEYARSSAIWPDAKLEDFTKENLEARLPNLLKEFEAAMKKFEIWEKKLWAYRREEQANV